MFWNHSKQHSSKTLKCKPPVLLLFWNHSKQHSSKTCKHELTLFNSSFGTIRNSTALKLVSYSFFLFACFGTIRNSTALKRSSEVMYISQGFGTIRNSTALKHSSATLISVICFGTIRNSTALKPRGPIFLTKSRNRAICLSQTSVSNSSIMLVLLYLKNLDFSTFLNNLKTYSCNFFLQIFC